MLLVFANKQDLPNAMKPPRSPTSSACTRCASAAGTSSRRAPPRATASTRASTGCPTRSPRPSKRAAQTAAASSLFYSVWGRGGLASLFITTTERRAELALLGLSPLPHHGTALRLLFSATVAPYLVPTVARAVWSLSVYLSVQ